MKKWFVCVVVGLLVFLNSSTSEAQGRSYVVMDMQNGRTLMGSNEHIPLPIASLTKIWTAYVVLENSELSDEVTISKRASLVEGSSIYVEEGQVYTVEHLLYGLMMRSGNDAAVALAEHVGGSVEGFVQLMNEQAQYNGLKQTHFDNPTGLHEPTHLASAYDTAKMLQIAMQNEAFRKIASTKLYKEGAHWSNKHRLLHQDIGATIGKTGYTKVAGRTLATFFEREQKQFIIVTINEGNDWNVHRNLADEIEREYDIVTIADKGPYKQNDVTIYLQEPMRVLIKKGELEQFRHVVYLSRVDKSKRAVWHVYLKDELLMTKLVRRN
ncbi:MAG: D-alanyl-D-alanine carboxypeptidase family protein [Solibacillus sp.]|uniref:D-alanyl-D-alanine carboxypeptidase family protein n=1 Tax=unclassified Solibacillus TaxID=2637870 RepID=UPI0030F6C41C